MGQKFKGSLGKKGKILRRDFFTKRNQRQADTA
jgi:hypothetical protein